MGRTQGLQLLSPRTAACSDTASSMEENESGELGAQKAWVSGYQIRKRRQTDRTSCHSSSVTHRGSEGDFAVQTVQILSLNPHVNIDSRSGMKWESLEPQLVRIQECRILKMWWVRHPQAHRPGCKCVCVCARECACFCIVVYLLIWACVLVRVDVCMFVSAKVRVKFPTLIGGTESHRTWTSSVWLS